MCFLSRELCPVKGVVSPVKRGVSYVKGVVSPANMSFFSQSNSSKKVWVQQSVYDMVDSPVGVFVLKPQDNDGC